MNSKTQNFSRYFPPDAAARHWGWQLMDAGRQTITAGMPYPGPGHPLAYRFGAQGRRTLDEFQLIFITKGQGFFASSTISRTPVESGDAFILYPGEWHQYHPCTTSGWSEFWMGFRGTDAEKTMHNFFPSHRAIHRVQQAGALTQHFEQLLHWLRLPVLGREQVLAAHIPLALAFLRVGKSQEKAVPEARLVEQAKAEMLSQLDQRSDLESLARQLGVSYSRLRFAFKRQTGYAPREFENAVKLNRACDLLLHEDRNISETANLLGYSSIFYFSRAFKRHHGCSPTEWLHKASQR